eukprot:8219487-Ditylum_brightwellii.AAC.1
MSASNIDSSYTSDKFRSDPDIYIYDCDGDVSDTDDPDIITLEEPETDDNEDIHLGNDEEKTNTDGDESL